MIEVRHGGYYRYSPTTNHCRQGMAYAELLDGHKVVLLDTFWGFRGSGDPLTGHNVSGAEMDTLEFMFHPSDGWRLATDQEVRDIRDYDPQEVQMVTSQGSHRKQYWLKEAALPQLSVKIKNAEAELEGAKSKVDSAQRWVEYLELELEKLVAQESSQN